MFPIQVLMILTSALAALLVTRSFSRYPHDGLMVRNFRGVETPVTGGLALLVGLIVAEGMAALVSSLFPTAFGWEYGSWVTDLTFGPHAITLALALGFFALGAADDLAGSGAAKGLVGHARALLQGRITGGMVKAGGGLALSFAVSLSMVFSTLADAILNATLISLSANLVNLLDLRPGRSVKSFLVVGIPFLAWASLNDSHLLVLAALVGGALVWLPADLKESGMLGDSGANMLGAVLGAGVAFSFFTPAKIATLGILIILTLISEKWSFDAMIERVPPLRWFDRLGRMP